MVEVPALARCARAAIRRIDERARAGTQRTALIYVRNGMHLGVLAPIARRLEADPRIRVRCLAESPDKQAHIEHVIGQPQRWVSEAWARFRRIDLLISADPWNPPTLHRCFARMNFFHGVAGKYNLDDPSRLPIGFHEWDRVAFINADRLERYAARGILKPGAAVLVGYPKLDALANGEIDGAAVLARLGLDPSRSTALYAPTWSPASSLNVAGETIIRRLADAGLNVIVKPHDLSFDLREKYSGGIDWRARLSALERPRRIVLADDADASPLLAASQVLVTDHSSIAFEYCVLDRPIVVVHAPDLARVARINPEQIARLRSVASVVEDPNAVGDAAVDALACPARNAVERAALAAEAFFDPGRATDRAALVAYELLQLDPVKPRSEQQQWKNATT